MPWSSWCVLAWSKIFSYDSSPALFGQNLNLLGANCPLHRHLWGALFFEREEKRTSAWTPTLIKSISIPSSLRKERAWNRGCNYVQTQQPGAEVFWTNLQILSLNSQKRLGCKENNVDKKSRDFCKADATSDVVAQLCSSLSRLVYIVYLLADRILNLDPTFEQQVHGFLPFIQSLKRKQHR